MITSSLKCVLSRIKAIVNLTISENGLNIKNPFANVFFPDISSGSKRLPVPSRDINIIKTHACLLMMRLDGLLDSLAIQDRGYLMLRHYYKEDVRLDHFVPHIIITPNAHRRLKNSANERIVPISGVTLWAVEQATRSTSSAFLFSKYMKTGICNANSASATTNKCIKSIVSPNV